MRICSAMLASNRRDAAGLWRIGGRLVRLRHVTQSRFQAGARLISLSLGA
jgi:hypothetical protein